MKASLICSRFRALATTMVVVMVTISAAAATEAEPLRKCAWKEDCTEADALRKSGWWDDYLGATNMSHTHHCEWEGIVCDGGGQVTGIHLNGITTGGHQLRNFSFHSFPGLALLSLQNWGLNGTIPPQIGALSSLQILDLSRNQLTGELPETLGQLHQLSYLYLSANELTGELPETLGQLESLRYLDLSFNELTGELPETLGQLHHLSYLDLSRNELTGDLPEALCQLHNLSYLDLSHNELTGELPETLGRLESLCYLNLGSNKLTGLVTSFLSQLQITSQFNCWGQQPHLDLSYNDLTGSIPETLGNLKGLSFLSLHHNRITGDIPSALSTLINLQVLYLQSNNLTGTIPDIRPLKLLRDLDLSHNQMTGTIPIYYNNVPYHLNLSHNNLSGKVPAFPFRSDVDISYNSFEGHLPHILVDNDPNRYAGNPKLYVDACSFAPCYETSGNFGQRTKMFRRWPLIITSIAISSICGLGFLFLIIFRYKKATIGNMNIEIVTICARPYCLI